MPSFGRSLTCRNSRVIGFSIVCVQVLLFIHPVRVLAQGTTEGPPLEIELSDESVVLSWTTSAPSFVVESKTNLSSGGLWQSVPGTPLVSGPVYRLTLPMEGVAVYYRLAASCAGSDVPDAQYVDANCDGIDGDPDEAVFVAPAPFGSSTGTGTRESPVSDLATAIDLARQSTPSKDVYVARGTYQLAEPLQLASGVNLYGQYDGTLAWGRAATNDTVIRGASTAAWVTNLVEETRVEGIQIVASDASVPGESSYAVRVYRSVGLLVLSHCTLVAGSGAAGVAGTNGAAGLAGGTGGDGEDGEDGGEGGGGGSSPCGRTGGPGGDGGYGGRGQAGFPGIGWDGVLGSPGSAGAGGEGGSPCEKGERGKNGYAGMDGPNGVNGGAVLDYGSLGEGAFVPGRGLAGTSGGPGGGGGGAGGGGANAYALFGCFVTIGGGGGGGGGGGCPGEPGGPGGGGGGAFAVFASYGVVTVSNCVIRTGNGGSGGQGGNGGLGGAGGGIGGYGDDTAYGNAGDYGGAGGKGGAAGSGSGGPGGPVIGVFGDRFSDCKVEQTGMDLGLPGLGGLGGTNGVLPAAPAGPSGIRRDTLFQTGG